MKSVAVVGTENLVDEGAGRMIRQLVSEFLQVLEHALVDGDDLEVVVRKGIAEDDTANTTCAME